MKACAAGKQVCVILAQSISDVSAAEVVNRQTWVTPGTPLKTCRREEGVPGAA